MRNYSRIVLTGMALCSLAACGNLSNVKPDGTAEQLVWPKISQDTFNHDGSQFGSWPNWNNVRMIERGMNKDQIRALIGNPQFNEGLYGVREWDYAFNYRENGIHKICQYKVLFDKNMNAQTFLWFPNGCYSHNQFTLAGDFLFGFNQSNLTAEGRQILANLAKEIKKGHIKEIMVAGYTDRLGSNAYNLALSQRRANRVKQQLIADGVTSPIKAVGYGKEDQVKACDGVEGAALKACLKPNRRVVVTINGTMANNAQTYKMEAGTQGPAILYQK